MPGEAAMAASSSGSPGSDALGGIDGPLLILVETIEALSQARSVDQIAAIVRSGPPPFQAA